METEVSPSQASQELLFENVFEPASIEESPEVPENLADRKEYPVRPSHWETLDRVCESYRLRLNGFHPSASYYRYQGLTHTIRARKNQLLFRISHHFESQPDRVIEAVGHILLRKLLGMRSLRSEVRICREAEEVVQRLVVPEDPIAVDRCPAEHLYAPPAGVAHDLSILFRRLCRQFFDGNFPEIPLHWSKRNARRYWGKYYPDPPRIIVNSRLDDPRVPVYVVEAVLYHEMLHHFHGIHYKNGRRRIHTPAFRRAERRFPFHVQAEAFLEDFQLTKNRRD